MATQESDQRQVLKPTYVTYRGLRLCGSFDEQNFEQGIAYKPVSGDVFIVTYPKCGTTWTQQIVHLLAQDGVPPTDSREVFVKQPFLECVGTDTMTVQQIKPYAIKTHLPFHLTPWSDAARYLVVVRNPLDACVSLFHHTRLFSGNEFPNGDWNVFFDLFLAGEVEYNDWFDHVAGWWAQRSRPNIKFITYESMKRDPRRGIEEIAAFIGMSEKLQQTDATGRSLLDKTLEYSSFRYMSAMPDYAATWNEDRPDEEVLNNPNFTDGIKRLMMGQMRATRRIKARQPGLACSGKFIRKGEVKDWKNLMTPHQSAALRDKFHAFDAQFGLSEIWKADLSWLE